MLTRSVIKSSLKTTCTSTTFVRSSVFIQTRTLSFTSKAPISPSPLTGITPTQNLQIQPTKKKEVYIKPCWAHPVYTEQQMKDIIIAHRETKNWSDKLALMAITVIRKGFDLASGYKHDHKIAMGEKDPAKGQRGYFAMTPNKWLVRFIFLESIAGVPGFVAGTLRHLKSLRTLKRDNGWIETLLEEGYNERMHLLSFLKLYEPGFLMKIMVIGAQGVFYNAFFLAYLASPRTCHRFVGYLEEEAVITYTRAIADIEAGRLPEFETMLAPDIALQYWNMPKGSTMKDLLLYIRADEAKHREVNHTLANLDPANDPNPFLTTYEDPTKPHPSKTIEHIKPTGWEREEVFEK